MHDYNKIYIITMKEKMIVKKLFSILTVCMAIASNNALLSMNLATAIAKNSISHLCTAIEFLAPSLTIIEGIVPTAQTALRHYKQNHENASRVCPCCRPRLHCARVCDYAIETAGLLTALATLRTLTNNYIPHAKENFCLHNSLKLARGALLIPLFFQTINQVDIAQCYYNRHDFNTLNCEYSREVETIQLGENHIEFHYKTINANMLTALMKKYETQHETFMSRLRTTKETTSYGDILLPPQDTRYSRAQLLAIKILPTQWFNKPFVMDTIFHLRKTVPSAIGRVQHLKQAIENIQAQNEPL